MFVFDYTMYYYNKLDDRFGTFVMCVRKLTQERMTIEKCETVFVRTGRIFLRRKFYICTGK